MAGWEHTLGDLLNAHRAALVEDIHVVETLLVPSMGQTPAAQRTEGTAAIVVAIEHFLRGGPPDQLVTVIRDAAISRLQEGSTLVEVCLLTHSFLGPVRRLLTQRLGIEEGLSLFERAEPRLLTGLRVVHEQLGHLP